MHSVSMKNRSQMVKDPSKILQVKGEDHEGGWGCQLMRRRRLHDVDRKGNAEGAQRAQAVVDEYVEPGF